MPDGTPTGEPREPAAREFRGEDARQGEIILRTRLRRIIFIAGLVGFVVLAVLLAW